MKRKPLEKLSRRERQIMEILYREGEGKVSEVKSAMSDPPSYSAVRALLGVLVDKGLLKFRRDGRAYVYSPTISAKTARESALKHMVQTFFGGSVSGVVASLVNSGDLTLSEEELKKLEELVEKSRKKGRKK